MLSTLADDKKEPYHDSEKGSDAVLFCTLPFRPEVTPSVNNSFFYRIFATDLKVALPCYE